MRYGVNVISYSPRNKIKKAIDYSTNLWLIFTHKKIMRSDTSIL